MALSAYRRRRLGTMIAAAAAEGDVGGNGVQRWCFWSWARVARDGSAAVARRARREQAEKELPGVKEMLSAAVERARGAEFERDRHGRVWGYRDSHRPSGTDGEGGLRIEHI